MDRHGPEHNLKDELQDPAPPLICTCTAQGVCDYLSPQWVAYTGVPEADQLGLRWLEQVHPEDRDGVLAAWSAAAAQEKPFKLEYRLKRYDGTFRWFDTRAIPLRNVENQIVKWFSAGTDIHKTRETSMELERQRRLPAKLVTQAPAGFCSFALRPDGTAYFPYASPDIVDLYGLTPEQLRMDAAHIFAITHEADLANVQATISQSAKSLSPWSAQFRVRHARTGDERWIEGQSAPSMEANGTIVWHGFLTDITERKQLEADQQFLLRVNSAMQPEKGTHENVQAVVELMAEYFGVARCSFSQVDAMREEATILCQHARVGPASRPGVRSLSSWSSRELMDSLRAGETAVIESTASHPATAGKYSESFQPAGIEALLAIPLRRGGEWVAVLSLTAEARRRWSQREIELARSAAERIWPAYDAARALAAERAEHASLAASEERLRLALQSWAIGIWDYDAVTMERNWDQRSRSIYGFPPGLRLTDELILSCIHPEDRELVDHCVRSFSDPNGSGQFDTEYRIVTWNGMGIRHLYGKGKMLFEGEGGQRRAIRAIGTMQDITALKQGEEALRRVNRELEQFAYAAAHDLQEPLRNVSLATQILSSKYQGKFGSDADTLFKIAVEGPMRMQDMVKDLLAYSRALTPEDGTVLLADGNDILATALKNLLTALEENNAQISWERLPKVRISELHLLQLFQNLIGNSLKYSGERQPRIHVAAENRRGECVLSVRDNGVGIPPELHDRAFGVFKRLHMKDVPGTGIGLALCKRIVEYYGGKIWIESQVNEGTTILFTAPLAEEAVEAHG